MARKNRLLFTRPGVPTGSVNIDSEFHEYGEPVTKEEKRNWLRLWLVQEGRLPRSVLADPKPKPEQKPKRTFNLPQLRTTTKEQEIEILVRYGEGGISQARLAEEYGIGQSHVSQIVRNFRKRWPNEPVPVAKPKPEPRPKKRNPNGVKDECSVPGCTDDAMVRGWCNKHYIRWRKYGDPLQSGPVKPRFPSGPCSVEGCDRGTVARGMCTMHYQRWRKTEREVPECKVDGCSERSQHMGMCQKHYYRMRRRGTTDEPR